MENDRKKIIELATKDYSLSNSAIAELVLDAVEKQINERFLECHRKAKELDSDYFRNVTSGLAEALCIVSDAPSEAN